MIETINKLIRTSRALVQELGREPTSEEIAKRMDIPVAKVRKVLKIAQQTISLETPIGAEEDSHLGDFIEDRQVVSPAEAMINVDLQEQTESVLRRSRRAKNKSSRCGSASATAASTRSKRSARVSGSPASASGRSRPRRSASSATRHAAESFVRSLMDGRRRRLTIFGQIGPERTDRDRLYAGP